MGLLLIGCGYWGNNWAKTLHRMGELAAVCDDRPAITAQIKANYPHVGVYSHLTEALNHPGLEGAIIATPVVTHREIARACLLAGKSVLVEKPLTLDPAEAIELVTLADGCGLILAVGHLLLYHPALRKLKSLMDEGVLGDILGVQCTRVNLGKVRNEENVWWSLAPHDLSIISLLLEEPLAVASAGRLNLLGRSTVEDAVYATFATPSGRAASVAVNWLSPTKRHETVVIGSEKIAIFEDTLPAEQKLRLLNYALPRVGGQVQDVRRGEMVNAPYLQPQDELLTLQAKAFLTAVRGERADLPNDGQSGAQVVRLLSEVQALLDAQRTMTQPHPAF